MFIDAWFFCKLSEKFSFLKSCLNILCFIINYFSQILDHYLHTREKKETRCWLNRRIQENEMHHFPTRVWTTFICVLAVNLHTHIWGNLLRNISLMSKQLYISLEFDHNLGLVNYKGNEGKKTCLYRNGLNDFGRILSLYVLPHFKFIFDFHLLRVPLSSSHHRSLWSPAFCIFTLAHVTIYLYYLSLPKWFYLWKT